MPVQITIIGLGQIGTSIGLALSEHKDKIYRVGNDIEISIARKAEKLGAVDKTVVNLPNAVKDAGVVILALPLDQIKATLEFIAADLKKGVVVMDTAPVKHAVMEWAQSILPEGCYYIGLTPVINPAYLNQAERGIDAARADLFQKGLFAVVTPPQSNSEAIDLALDLIALLGAEHMFVDVAEIDGLMAAVHLLPQFLSAAIADITIQRPGWREGRKLAGRPYSAVTGPSVTIDEAAALSQQALLNRDNLIRVMDNLIVNLEDFREQIASQKTEDLARRLEKIRQDWDAWLGERMTANWQEKERSMPVNMPTSGDVFGRLIGLRPAKDRKKQTGKKP